MKGLASAWPAWLTAVVAGLLFLALAMCAPLSRDEHMYVAAGALLRNGTLYKDFAYVQTPYLPYVYAALFAGSGGAWLLLVARVFTAATALLMVWAVYRACRQVGASAATAGGCTLLFATHHLVLFCFPYARNHVPALACATLALVLVLRAVLHPAGRKWACVGAGVLVGAALGLKLTQAPAAVALLAGLLVCPRGLSWKARWRDGVVPFGIGLLVALLPALLIAQHVGWDVFAFNNVGYHQLNAAWRALNEPARGTGAMGKLLYTLEYAVKGSGVLLLAGVAMMAFRTRAEPRPAAPSGDALIVTLLALVAAVVAAVVPTPMQRDYLAGAVPPVAVLLAWLVARRPSVSPEHVVVGLASASLVVGTVTSLRHLRYLPDAEHWTPIAVHRAGIELSRVVAEAGNPPGRIATLVPVYALEGGLPIYSELATGEFLYRSGDAIDPERQKLYRMTSPATVGDLLAAEPPAAVWTRQGDAEDGALRAFAEQRRYRSVAAPIEGTTLHVRGPQAQ